MGAEAVKGEAFNNSDDSLEPEANSQDLQKPEQLLDSVAPQVAASRNHQMAVDSSRYLYKSATKAQLRAFARVQNVLLHHTSIDTIGDFSAAALEILDDRIKSDSLTAVLVSLLVNVRGAPLRALSRSLQRYDTPLLHSVLNVEEPSSHSISGEVSGAEITIGDEEFLLQRGVLLDSLGDTLLEPGQQGFFLLIAISDAVVARVLITPPRIGDGTALVDSLTKEQIPVQIFSLGSSSQETRQFATEVGVSAEQIYAIDSMLHLDSFLDQRKPFLFVSSDIDCAAYVSSRGLVALLLEQEPAQSDKQHLLFRGLGLNSLVDLLAEARRLVRREKLMMIGLGALGVGIFIIAVLLIRS